MIQASKRQAEARMKYLATQVSGVSILQLFGYLFVTLQTLPLLSPRLLMRGRG
jgi:hypothetical protein